MGEKVARWPRKKPLDFIVNPDHVTLGLELGLLLGVSTAVYTPRVRVCYQAFVK